MNISGMNKKPPLELICPNCENSNILNFHKMPTPKAVDGLNIKCLECGVLFHVTTTMAMHTRGISKQYRHFIKS